MWPVSIKKLLEETVGHITFLVLLCCHVLSLVISCRWLCTAQEKPFHREYNFLLALLCQRSSFPVSQLCVGEAAGWSVCFLVIVLTVKDGAKRLVEINSPVIYMSNFALSEIC